MSTAGGPRKRLRDPRVVAGSALAALLLVVGVGALGSPAASTPGPTVSGAALTVGTTTGVCPEAGSSALTQSVVSLAVPPPGSTAATGTTGSAQLAPPGAGTSPVARLDTAGTSTAYTGTAADTVQVLTATGALAPGAGALQTARTSGGRQRGLSALPCGQTGNDFWFVGFGAKIGERGRLYLTNPGTVPVVVDVALYGAKGTIQAPSVQGITVAPGAQEVRLLDAVAPGAEQLGLHVTARQGRISAAVRDEKIDGLVARGIDWEAPVAPPASTTVVTGIPTGAGGRSLRILNPGTADAIVRLTVVGTQGSFTPSGLDVVDVPGESVAAIPVEKLVAADGAALQLVSDQPVTAAVVATTQPTGAQPGELAFAGATLPVVEGQPAVLASLDAGAGRSTQLWFAATDGDARLDLVPLGRSGPGDPVPVVVPDGGLVQVDTAALTKGGDTGVAVVLREGSHPVRVSAVFRETTPTGELLSVVPVQPGLQELAVPALRPVLPGR